MKSMIWTVVVTSALLASADSGAESAQDILEKAWDMQVSRWEGLDSYLVEQSVMGHASKQYFVRTVVTDSAGVERTMFLPAPGAGHNSGCVKPISLSEGSVKKGNSSAEYMSWFIDNAELIGEESVDGKAALHFRADGLEQLQEMGGEEVKMRSMSMWFSKGDYLSLKVRMDGVTSIQGQSQPVVVETLHTDFRKVPGSHLVEPFRRVMNMSGMLGGDHSEQIAEARKQMAEMEKQMADMPASQREMMKKMMGPQLEAMRKMGQSGGLETEVLIRSITPNPEIAGERVVACD